MNLKAFISQFGSLFRRAGHPAGLEDLQAHIDYRFHDQALLIRALTHRSYLHEPDARSHESNEMLEFLGDAVLELIVVEELYNRYPTKNEGDLSKLKSMLVSGESLKHIARREDLGRYLLLSRNEARNGGRNRGSILEDAFEALIAAIYLDGGLDAARRIVNKLVLPEAGGLFEDHQDNNFKSQLLEYTQARGLPSPMYRVISESGPDHAKRFEIDVKVGSKHLGFGVGRTKKIAQQQAAHDAFSRLNGGAADMDDSQPLPHSSEAV